MATIAPDVPVLARDEAFEQLYRRYVKDVYHYALALLRNPADAEDVTQTTFLNAYRAYQRGEVIRKPHNWLIKIAHNVARSRYGRVSRRVKEVPLEEHVDRLAVPEEERPNVEGVLHALGRLPFNQRAALIMRELEGRSYVEISETLGVSVAAVETLIFRARRSLRVRTAALRSILTVPLPSTLAQFLGESGGVAVGGFGAGMLIKTAVALVVGGLATGLGVQSSHFATASPRHVAPPPSQAQGAGAAGRATSPTAQTGPRALARTTRQRMVSKSPVRRGYTQGLGSQPAAGSVQGAVQSSGSSTPGSPSSAVTTTATGTVQTAVDTVEQTAATVTNAVSVTVPQVPPLPVQPPPLPQLP